MNYIEDSTFRGFPEQMFCTNGNDNPSGDWWIKTSDGDIKTYVTKVAEGLQFDARYEGLGYLYIRQEIPDVARFSGKKLTLKACITRASWQPLKCDVYIQAKLVADGSRRILVVDTPSIDLVEGENAISVPVVVPDLSNEIIEGGNTLQTAVRLVGETQNTQTFVNSIELVEESSPVLSQSQYEAVCSKIAELL